MITLPKYISFDTKKALLKNKKERFYPYERVAHVSGKYVRYFSNEESTCVGEYVLKTIKCDTSSAIVIAKINDEDNNYLFCLTDEKSGLISEVINDIDSLFAKYQYDFNICKKLICINTNEELDRFLEENKLFKNDLEIIVEKQSKVNFDDIPNEYKLKHQKKPNKKILIGFAALIIGGFIYLIYPSEQPRRIVTVQKTPTEQLTDDIQTLYIASDFFKSAELATAYSNLLPLGWSVSDISSSGDSIVLQIMGDSSTSRTDLLNEYFIKYPELKSKFDENAKTITFPLKMNTNVDIRNIKNYPNWLHDQLVILGANEAAVINIDDTSWTVSATFTNMNFTILNTLSTLFSNAPVFISTFNETSVKSLEPTFSFEVSVKGLNQ